MDDIVLKSVLVEILEKIRNLSECQSVGIRLHSNGDYPYYVHEGFPNFFILKEKTLVSKNQDGQDILDEQGNPSLDCMCGKVLNNNFDPKQACFTEKGSFWTNSTTELLGNAADQLGKTRNMCHQSGYESVALVPLKADGKTLGLIQFNDPRINMFTIKKIINYECLAGQIAAVISNAFEIKEKMSQLSKSMKQFKSAKN